MVETDDWLGLYILTCNMSTMHIYLCSTNGAISNGGDLNDVETNSLDDTISNLWYNSGFYSNEAIHQRKILGDNYLCTSCKLSSSWGSNYAYSINNYCVHTHPNGYTDVLCSSLNFTLL